MSYKKYIIFGLFLVCAGIVYVKFAASKKTGEIQGLLAEPIAVETNAMNLSVSIIAETDNDIIVKACDTPKNVFSDCTTNKLSKVSEHNGVKVYRKGTHDVAFIKDNGKWKTFGNVFLLSVMEEIEKQPKAIFARGCGDWKIAVMEETEKEIKVEDCAWGMGWSCSTYKIPKVSDQDGVKIYKKDEVIFTNNNGKWVLLGHLCSKVSSTEVLTHKCPKYGRTIKVNSYDAYGLIVVEIQDPHISCESKNDAIFMLKDTSITDKDIFINGDFRIEHTKNDWIIDEKLCDIIKDCSTNNWPEI